MLTHFLGMQEFKDGLIIYKNRKTKLEDLIKIFSFQR